MARDWTKVYARRDPDKLKAYRARTKAMREDRAKAAGFRNHTHQLRCEAAGTTPDDDASPHGMWRPTIAKRLAEMEAAGMFDDLDTDDS